MKRALVGGVLIILSLFGFWWFQPEASAEPVAANLSLEVAVQPKDGAVSFSVSEQGRALPEGLEVIVTLSTPAGPYVAKAPTTAEDFSLEIPYARAGLTPYNVRVGQSTVEGNFWLDPGPPVTPLIMAIGPRATRVQSHESISVVVHPLDRYKNVSDAPLTLQRRSSGTKPWIKEVQVSGLLAWSLIPALQQTGRLEVVAQSGQALAENGEIELLPGNLANLKLEVLKGDTSGDTRDAWQLKVAEAEDAAGNAVADGLSLNFIGQGENANFFATRSIIQGRHDMVLPSYGKSGTYTLAVQGSGFRSEDVALSTESIPERQLGLAWVSKDPLILHLGPVLSPSGAFLDDGTPVRIDVFKSESRLVSFFEVTQNGHLYWKVPSLPEGVTHLEIKVAGLHRQLRFEGP